MEKRLNELLEKEILTGGELEEIEEHSDVSKVEICGLSGRYIGFLWFNVVLENGDEYDVYVHDDEENFQ